MKSVVTMVALGLVALAQAAAPVINGNTVSASDYPSVVVTRVNGAMCSGVVIGPHVVATAAHCVITGATDAMVEAGGNSYLVKFTRSPLYPQVDHDIALGISQVAFSVKPAFVAHKFDVGMKTTIVGNGCDKAGGNGTMGFSAGEAEISRVNALEFITKGAAVCFGDSGAPAFVADRFAAGLGSKGNLADLSYFTRFDTNETESYFKKVIDENNVEICGFNSACDLD